MPTKNLTQKEIDEISAKRQREIIEKFQLKEEHKKELEKQEQQDINNNIEPTEKELTEWKNTGTIRNFQGTHLNLSEKASFGWGIEELTIEDCPNLRSLNLKRFSQTNQADEVQEQWIGSHNEQRSEFNGQLSKLTIRRCDQLLEIDASCNNLGNKSLIIDKISKFNLIDLDLHNNKELTKFTPLNYPRLKILNLDYCNLNKVDLKKRLELQNFSASGNKLIELDLTNNTKLVNLTVNNNKLRELKVNHLKQLETLYCYENQILELDCSGLSKLKGLYCSKNVVDFLHQNEEECSRLIEPWKIYVELKKKSQKILDKAFVEAEKFYNQAVIKSRDFYSESVKEKGIPALWNLNIDGCYNLVVLDIDCNVLEKTDYSNFPKLEQLSLTYNSLIETNFILNKILNDTFLTLSNLPNLIYFNYYGSNIIEVHITDCPKLIKGGSAIITEQTPVSQFLDPQGKCRIVNNMSASESVREGNDDPYWGELLVERQLQKEADELRKDNNENQGEEEGQKKKKKSSPTLLLWNLTTRTIRIKTPWLFELALDSS